MYYIWVAYLILSVFVLSCCARRCSCKAVCLGILTLTIAYLFTCLTSGQSFDAFFADTTVVTRALAMALDSCLTRILRTSESLHLAVVIAAVILLHLTILMLQGWKKVRRQTLYFATQLWCHGLEDATVDAITPKSTLGWSCCHGGPVHSLFADCDNLKLTS